MTPAEVREARAELSVLFNLLDKIPPEPWSIGLDWLDEVLADGKTIATTTERGGWLVKFLVLSRTYVPWLARALDTCEALAKEADALAEALRLQGIQHRGEAFCACGEEDHDIACQDARAALARYTAARR